MNKAAQKNLLIIASIAVATFTGSIVADDYQNRSSRDREISREKDTSREEEKNWGRTNKDNDPVHRKVGDGSRRDEVFGWAGADEFGNGLGMSIKERRDLFAFWDQQDLASRLNLTDEQREELSSSYKDTTEKIDGAKKDAREAIASLRQELDKPEPSVSDVESYSDQLADAMKARQKAVFSHAALVKKTLNTDQENVLISRNSNYPDANRMGSNYKRIEIPVSPQRPLVGFSPSTSTLIINGGVYEGYNPNTKTYTSRYGQVSQPSTDTPIPTPTPSIGDTETPTPTPVWGDSTDTPTPTPAWEGTSTATRTPGPMK